jgi:hypothetical protein
MLCHRYTPWHCAPVATAAERRQKLFSDNQMRVTTARRADAPGDGARSIGGAHDAGNP